MKRGKKISGYVSSADKLSFTALAQRHGTSESRLLSRLVTTVLRNTQSFSEQAILGRTAGKEEAGAATPASRHPCRAVVVSIRLLPQEVGLLEKEAEARSLSRSSFIYGLLKTHFAVGPYFGDAEIDVLRQSSAQMARLGANLNQITRRLNAGAEVSPESLPSLYQKLNDAVREHKEYVRRLIKENMRSWGVPMEDKGDYLIHFHK